MATLAQQLYSQNHWVDLDGVQTIWNFTFAGPESGSYILPAHVKAYYLDAAGARVDVTVTEEMLIGPFQLQVIPAIPATAQRFVIYRDTPKDMPLVDFEGGSQVTEANMDRAAKQAVFCAAEVLDGASVSGSLFEELNERLTVVETTDPLADVDYDVLRAGLNLTSTGSTTAVKIEQFNTPGAATWTKDAGAKLVRVIAIGAGGGAGGGMKRTTSAGCYSAGGGGGGARVEALFDAATLGATEAVAVGAGGVGGAGGTVTDTQGSAGSAGGLSSFGTTPKVVAHPGGGGAGAHHSGTGGGGGAGFSGAGGSTSNNLGGAAGADGGVAGGQGAAGNANLGGIGGGGGSSAFGVAGFPGGISLGGGCGGSGGGAVTSTPGVTQPGAGAVVFPGMTAAAAGTSGASPTAGANGPAPLILGQCGGGGAGGGSSITASVSGANGGAGGIGSGGGGGGSCYDAAASGGTGGNGGRGQVIVITYF